MKQKSVVALTLLISIILVSPTFLSLSAATSTFGQTAVGNNSAWQSGGVMVASRFTASGGTPTSISVYISQSGSSSNTAKCAIYSESNKQLFAVTEEKTINAGFNGWLTFNFGSSPSLASGSSYSLVVWFKGSHGTVRYGSGGAAQAWYAYQQYTGNFPNGPYSSLSGYGQENNVYSIYCTLNSDVTPSPTPSPLPSTSPSPSPSSTPTPSGSSSTFGQTTQGSNSAWQGANVMVSSRFTAPGTGSLNSVTVYISNGASAANYVKCAVYSETNKALVASSQELTISGGASGWFTFPTTSSPSIVEGQRYSLVVWFKNANCYLPYAPGTSSQSWYTHASYGNFPSTFNTNGQENNVYSLYATVTSGNSPSTPNPSPIYIPTPTPAPIPTPAPVASSKGELYLWLGFWMSPGDSTSQRIVNARQSSGIPIWIDTCNFDSPQITSSFINYFHAHGVKVVARLWSNGGNTPLNTILHDTNVNNQKGGSVDYQLSIGPEIDAFMIDECNQNNVAYYRAIADYVHSKGKLMFVNTGTFNIYESTLGFADKVSAESCGYELAVNPTKQSQIQANPNKFIGISTDWAYQNQPYLLKYASADPSIGRPAWSSPMSKERAVWDVLTAWNGGVSCYQAQPSSIGELPSWWEQYIAALQ